MDFIEEVILKNSNTIDEDFNEYPKRKFFEKFHKTNVIAGVLKSKENRLWNN